MPAPVINQGPTLTKRGKQTQVFTATNGVTSWSTSGGALSNTSAAGATWTAPNDSGTYTVTATNASGSAQVTIEVESVCPTHPSWGYSGKYAREFLQFIPLDGAEDREEVETEPYAYTLNMTANNRQPEVFIEFQQFHQNHYGRKKNFWFVHPGTGVEYLMYFDAELKEEWSLGNLASFSTVAKQVV